MKKAVVIIFFFQSILLFGQDKIQFQHVVSGVDTMLNGVIPDLIVKEAPSFKTTDEYYTYLRYKRYAEKVYPYAVQAVKAYNDVKDSVQTMGFFERRRFIRDKQHELKSKFEDPLINLSKGQGKVLIKMIERKLQIPMYEVIDETKGSFTAVYWNILGKTNGYQLKDGYKEGDDRILDLVIDDYNIPD
jgi:Domain of unknown function (DUF4294)